MALPEFEQDSAPPALSHLDADGDVHMIDVGEKAITQRQAAASCVVELPELCRQVLASGGDTAKGNVFQVARLAGIMAGKRTAELIPLCHSLPLDAIEILIETSKVGVTITARVRCTARTGVEMEALTAASVAALTMYDMLKALSHDIIIGPLQLIEKSGGRSGTIRRPGAAAT